MHNYEIELWETTTNLNMKIESFQLKLLKIETKTQWFKTDMYKIRVPYIIEMIQMLTKRYREDWKR